MIRIISGVVLAVVMLAAAPRAQAQVLVFVANLSGPAESPPNNSPGTGFAQVDYNPTAHTMLVQATFTGLTGTTTMAHIHAATAVPFTGTAGVATTVPNFPSFPVGVTAGSYNMTFDMTQASSYNPAYITANGGTPATAELALATSLTEGRAYFNIHSSTFGGGEIRGFLVVPEPGTLALSSIGALAALKGVRRRVRGAKSVTA